jgi:phenylalanyl-tRNA synthetase beta chain
LNTIWSLLQNKKLKSQEVLKFPGIRRDLSLLLPYQLTFQEIFNFIYSLDIPALKDINLFDVYIQPEWQNTKKSYALSFYFIDPDRTLQDEEVDGWMQEIMNALSEKWDVSIR